jgi:hypothetical protein
MAEVLVAGEDLTVLGGPTTINLQTDFGSTGQRGSLIYASNGAPSDPNSGIPSDVLPYDLAINISASSNRYLTVYQYFSADGASGWNELTRLAPNVGAVNLDIYFANGVSQQIPGTNGIAIPISSITQSTELTPANFNIQYSIESITPILSSILISPTFFTIANIVYLGFQINAVEFNGTGFAAVDGVSKKVNLLITVI